MGHKLGRNMEGKEEHNLRYFQIQVAPEHARHLPGVKVLEKFSKTELITNVGLKNGMPYGIYRVEYDSDTVFDNLDELSESFIVEGVFLKSDGVAFLRAFTPGPTMQIVERTPNCWTVPPTSLSRSRGLFMTVQGTSDGLKLLRDAVLTLFPTQIDLRISKNIKADWISAPKLPRRRHDVMRMAVDMGYYATPRRCTQKMIADALGIRQGTVGEHLQMAEGNIIESWSKQTNLS